MQMKRHEFWRMQYRRRRYLEHLSNEELEQRTKDVFCNLTVLSDKGQISFHPINEEGEYWMIMWTHLLEEFTLRHGPYPAGFSNGFIKDAQIVKPTYPEIPKAVEAIKGRDLRSGTFLVKYGKYQYLRPAFEKGLIRVAPASFYDDPSLNPAIKDNELELSVFAHPSDVEIQIIDENTGAPTSRVAPFGNVIYTLKSPTNYYVYCLSSIYAYRTFDDFEADCCLMITQPREFIRRLLRAFDKNLNGWRGFATAVTYVDPMNANPNNLDVFFSKHFRYSYQKEYRAIWLPPNTEDHLDPFMLELGSLKHLSELIPLEVKKSA